MPVCITALLVRRSDITHEEFTQRWLKHTDLISDLPYFKEHVISYRQKHNIDLASHLTTDPAATEASDRVNTWDGVAEFYVEKIEDFMGLFADAQYNEVIVPDEVTFLDKSKTMVQIAEDKYVYTKSV